VAREIAYANSGDAFIAYQVIGDGPRDLLVMMDGFVPIDTTDDEPRLARTMKRLASLARLVRFDRRGIGLSDPVSPSTPPSLEHWVADALAVADAADAAQPVVLAASETCPIALLLAATHPERVGGLILVNGYARAIECDDYPEGMPRSFIEEIIVDATDPAPAETAHDWTALIAPSAAGDPHFRRWWDETGRRGASPATARALLRAALESDVRSVLPTVTTPALVLQLDAAPSVNAARYLAAHLPGAKHVEIPGADDFWWVSDSAPTVLDEIEEFLTGVRGRARVDRALASVLFTDIVDSTRRASELGDRAWRDLLDRHDAAVRRQLRRFGGREVKRTGDGFLATFDGPARAVECATAIVDAARQVGLEVRAGVHAGEVEVRGDDIGGIAVHIAARVAALADASSVWVSRTVTDLVVGSGLTFADRGTHALKGVPDDWQLFAVAD
jgi:class 3 adenylate cyclase